MNNPNSLQNSKSVANQWRLPLTLLSALFISACSSSSDNVTEINDNIAVIPAQESGGLDTTIGSAANDDSDSSNDESEEEVDTDAESLDDVELAGEELDDELDDDSELDDDNELSEADNELVSDDDTLLDDEQLVDEDNVDDSDLIIDPDDALAETEEEDVVPVFSLPTSFTTVEALTGIGISNTETVRVQETLGVESPFVSEVFGFSSNDDSTVLGVQQFTQSNSNGVSVTNVDHYAVDVNSLSIAALFQTNVASSGALSDNFTQLALSENCQAFTRRINSGSAGNVVNQLTVSNVCFTEASISDNGDTAVFIASPAGLGVNGTTVPAGGFNSESGPVIVHRPSGTVTSLNLDSLTIPGTLTQIYNFSYASDVDISADGSTVAARLQFIPNVQSGLALVEVLSLIVIVDAASGELTAIDQQFARRAICSSCETTSAYDLEISDDGQRLLFLRPADDQITEINADSILFVHNRATAETVALDIEDSVTAGTLTIDGSATQAAFVNTLGAPILLNLDSGDRVDMDAAIRGCDSVDVELCTFDSYQFVTDHPLALNANGAVLSLVLTPESPLPISEAFLLDTESLQIDRLAPNRQVNRVVADVTGDNIAYSGVSGAGGDQQQSEIFLIRR